jgi:hypothetical protein
LQAGEVQAALLPKAWIRPTSIDQMVEVLIFKRILPAWWRGRLSWLSWKRIMSDLSLVTRAIRCPYHMKNHITPLFKAMGFRVTNKDSIRRAFDQMEPRVVPGL